MNHNKLSAAGVSRRIFVRKTALLACGTALARLAFPAEPTERVKKRTPAAIIGHTGRGDYGHGLDLIFNGREGIQVVGIADPNPSGRAQAARRCQATRGYDDYWTMLEKERPRLVCIAPRWTDRHHAMALAALKSGAHIYLEKPITQTLAEADELLALAGNAGLKIAVAHQMRLAPNILYLKKMMDQGLLGELVQMRAHGKQDSRAGGEDLLVLGTHLFDLMRFFAGETLSCTARVLQNGREITRQDAHTAKENIGLIAGDEIEAQFGFANGVNASFTSSAKLRQTLGPWGLDLIGSKAAARILADIFPRVYILKAGTWKEGGKSDVWEPMENDPTLNATEAERSIEAANKRVVDDWLDAIEKNRLPVCGGFGAMKALEMVMAVYEAGLSGTRVQLPLLNRAHPLI